MNIYKNSSDADLIEAYDSMMSYSGSINNDMKEEIERRGGMDIFRKKIETIDLRNKEKQRIGEAIFPLCDEATNADFIRQFIQSDIFTKEELDAIVEKKFNTYRQMRTDKKVDRSSVIKSITGIALGSIFSGVMYGAAINFYFSSLYILPIPIYIFCRLILRSVTGQSRNNRVVFLSTIIAFIFALVLGLILADYLVSDGIQSILSRD